MSLETELHNWTVFGSNSNKLAYYHFTSELVDEKFWLKFIPA